MGSKSKAPAHNDNEARDALLIQRMLGDALRLSLARIAKEPLPSEIALLLVRLAVAEVLGSLTDYERGPCCERHVSPDDKALIEREIGSALRRIYHGVAFEPLPDQIKARLVRLAAREFASRRWRRRLAAHRRPKRMQANVRKAQAHVARPVVHGGKNHYVVHGDPWARADEGQRWTPTTVDRS